jgi:hypothetical protein
VQTQHPTAATAFYTLKRQFISRLPEPALPNEKRLLKPPTSLATGPQQAF